MGRSSGNTEIGFISIFLVLGAIVFLALAVGVTDEPHSKRILEKQGYTDVSFTGYDWFACSEDDWYHTGFVATSPSGDRLSGAVCCGLIMKSCTVRFD